jgi:hypothetical protein
VESERKEEERTKIALWRKRMRTLEIYEAFFLNLESLNMGPSELFPSDISGANNWQSTLCCESSILLRTSLFHYSTRVFRWDADPK